MSHYAIGVRNPDGTYSDVSAANPLPISGSTTTTGGATAANQTTELSRLGDVTETSPASDTASSGINGRLQRIAQNITSLISRIPGPASTGTTVSVASSATAVTLKAANTSRKSISISNDSTSILYILNGAGTVSATNYTVALAPKGTVASFYSVSDYTGIITGLWSAANGVALVTELT